jgi:hypothetical protein
MRTSSRTWLEPPRRRETTESESSAEERLRRLHELQCEVATLQEMRQMLERIRRRMIRRLAGSDLGSR